MEGSSFDTNLFFGESKNLADQLPKRDNNSNIEGLYCHIVVEGVVDGVITFLPPMIRMVFHINHTSTIHSISGGIFCPRLPSGSGYVANA